MGVKLKFRPFRLNLQEKLKNSQRFIVYTGAFFVAGLFGTLINGIWSPRLSIFSVAYLGAGALVCFYELQMDMGKRAERLRAKQMESREKILNEIQ